MYKLCIASIKIKQKEKLSSFGCVITDVVKWDRKIRRHIEIMNAQGNKEYNKNIREDNCNVMSIHLYKRKLLISLQLKITCGK